MKPQPFDAKDSGRGVMVVGGGRLALELEAGGGGPVTPWRHRHREHPRLAWQPEILEPKIGKETEETKLSHF